MIRRIRIRNRDPQDLHAEMAHQANRLARIKDRDSRCAYGKAMRRETEAAKQLARRVCGGWR